MSELERELAHARAMSTAEHRPDCTGRTIGPPNWVDSEWARPRCPGCVTAKERALWAQLADEYQAQIDRHREDTLL